MDIKEAEKIFLEELNLFRNEVESVLKFVYTEITIRTLANEDPSILSSLNKTPNFWNTILNSLQHSIFLTLGRIFDPNQKHHSLRKLVGIIKNNPKIFSEESFSCRWNEDKEKQEILDYLGEHLETFYVLTTKDIRDFANFINKQDKIYQEIFRDVRDHFAHRIYSGNEEIQTMFNKIKLEQLEKFSVNLLSIHQAIWQLFHNGRGPLLPLNSNGHSTKEILKHLNDGDVKYYINEQITKETHKALSFLTKGVYQDGI
jgi:hypothetical protein